MNARIILFCGKGGVGKTTAAAATAVACAQRKLRTLVISFDMAHSLSDSFGLDVSLFEQNSGLAFSVAENLDVQEINVPREIERHWGEIYRYLATLLTSTGLSDVIAEEVAIMPGMEDVISLMYINQYIREKTYDVIVVDCPPTGESLRFVNITSTVEWYMLKRFRIDRTLTKLAKPIADRISDYQLPNDTYFQALQSLFSKLKGVDALLADAKTTTVRFVTNPERMVLRETQRAFMYFSLYGVTTDMIIINRVMPATKDAYYQHWSELQSKYVEETREYFEPVPVKILPLFQTEIVGIDRLREVAKELYGKSNPLESKLAAPPFAFAKRNGNYALTIRLPFAEKKEIDVDRIGNDLIIKLGNFKRHVPLPQSLVHHTVSGARLDEGQLIVNFSK